MKVLNDKISVSGQVLPEQLADLAAQGYSTLICNRPDNEEPGQPAFAEVAAAAEAVGITAVHIPVVPGQATADDAQAFGKAMAEATGKVHAFCKGGGRAEALYNASGA